MVLTGLKTAAVEIISSATLAAKIGAGGLGDIIFTGIGLYRTDLLIIGGVTVAALSLTTGLLFAVIEKVLFPYNNV
jgi:osmoprotectant transport system permease protein